MELPVRWTEVLSLSGGRGVDGTEGRDRDTDLFIKQNVKKEQ